MYLLKYKELKLPAVLSLAGPPGKRDYMENFQPGKPGSRHRDTGISANRVAWPGCLVIAKLIFVAFNKRAKIPANFHQPG